MERNSRSSRDSERGGRSSGRDSERGSSRGGREDSGRGSSRGSSYEYKKRDASKIKERESTLGGGDFDKYFRDDVKVFSPAAGDNCIRIMPPTWDGPDHYGFDIWVHYKVGPDEQTYLCLKKMKNEDCPCCDERADALKDGDEDFANELKPKQRVVVALIDRSAEKEGPQVWAMPWGVDKDLLSRSTDKRTGEVLALDDPHEGFDVDFKKEGAKLQTKYIGISLARRESTLGKPEWLEWIVDNPLPSLLKYFTYDHIKAVLGGASNKSKAREVDQQDEDLKKVEQSGDRESSRNGRGASRQAEPDLTWDSVHSMTFDELAALVDEQKLTKIEPNESKDDDELADWICEDLDIKKVVARRKAAEDTKDETPASKMAEMRRRREA